MSSPPSSYSPLARLRQFLSFFRQETPIEANHGSSSMKKSVHFGGGNIGRGFVAQFLHESGYEVVFVDVMDKLIESLQNTKSYTVTEVSADGESTKTIDNYRAINSKHELAKVIDEISTADVVTCAVGPNILKFIAEPIARGIINRQNLSNPLAVIACENAIGATDTLRELIVDWTKKNNPDDVEKITQNARFANSAIDRIVPKQDPDAGLNVKIEKFYEWCVESEPFEGKEPKIDGIHYVDNLQPYIERKLYTVNTAHATAAYYGYHRGKKFIHEAMQDEEINRIVRDTVAETANLIVEAHGIAKADQDEYVAKIIKRISAEFFGDEVIRVGRAPIRKLGFKERFIGPARQIADRNGDYTHLLGGVEMALQFQNIPEDEESAELAKLLADKDAESVTAQLTGLDRNKNKELFDKVVLIVEKVQAGTA